MLSLTFRNRLTAIVTLGILAFLLASDSAYAQGRTRVRGYYRRDGTYVAPHYRTLPDGIRSNNYSYPGNYNPNKGAITPLPGTDVWVNGYFRADGTYVNGHYRSAPRSTSVPTPKSPDSPVLQNEDTSRANSVAERRQAETSARAEYWKKRGYEFDPKSMTAYAMDQKVKDIERAKYWDERGYHFDPEFMTAYTMDQKVKDIERAKYWNERGYHFDPEFMTAYTMDRIAREAEERK